MKMSNWMGLGASVLLALGAGGVAISRRRRGELLADAEVLARLFNLVGVWAGRLRVPWRASQTPLERAAAFNDRLPEAAPTVDQLAGLFVAQRYGRVQPEQEAVALLARAWEHLQPGLWKRWLASHLGEVGATAGAPGVAGTSPRKVPD